MKRCAQITCTHRSVDLLGRGMCQQQNNWFHVSAARKTIKKKRLVKNQVHLVQRMCKSYYLTIASTSCWVKDPRVVLQGVRNSFASYLVRIQCSFSSREAVGDGFVTWLWPERIVDSHTEFERLFPMASITLIWLGLKIYTKSRN